MLKEKEMKEKDEKVEKYLSHKDSKKENYE